MANSYPGGLETPKSIDKPSAFVGSSSEALVFARAARSLLDNDARVTVWNEGFFSPGTTTIEALINALPRFDFSIIILKSDDLIRSRNIEALSPRDNVIFELGLFMAHLGRNRTFIVCQQGTKLPTDLAGVATITYEHPQNSESANVSLTEAIEALGAACDRIREAIRDLGVSPTRTSKQLGQVAQRQDVLESKVRALQIVVKGIVTEFEWEKLDRLALDGQFLVRFHNDMIKELQRLDAIRYVQPQPGYGIESIRQHDGSGNEFDLKRYVRITNDGLEYLKLRKELLESP